MRSPLLWAGLGVAALWAAAGLVDVVPNKRLAVGHAADSAEKEQPEEDEIKAEQQAVTVDGKRGPYEDEHGSGESANAREKREYSLADYLFAPSPDWVSAFAAVAGVLLLFLTVRATNLTLKQAIAANGVARATLVVTQDIGLRQTRPYIAVTGVEALLRQQYFTDGTGVLHWVVFGHINLENSGNSPPRELTGAVICRFRDGSSKVETWTLPEWRLVRPQIGANRNARTDFHFNLDEGRLAAIRTVAKDTIIEISGAIRYKALAGEEVYETRFDYFSGLRVLKDEMMAFMASDKGNDAT